jgi:hypothetical protein
MIHLSEKQKEAVFLIEHDPHVTQLLYGGAAFGGKTLLGCYWQIFRRLCFPKTRGLIGRSELKNLKLTTLKTFFEVWDAHWKHVTDDTITFNQQDHVIYFSNGSEIYLKDTKYYPSDPDFASLGSLEVTDAFIDEAAETTEKAFNIIYSRIRYKLINDKPVILLGSNPANNWLKTSFVMDANNQPITLPEHRAYVRARVDDNPDKERVKIYKSTLEKLPLYDRLRLLDGDWSVNENDSPFFYEYNSDRHIGAIEINKFEPLWLSFDFNIDPTTCVIGQKIDGMGVYVHQCVQLKGGTAYLCEQLEWVKSHPGGIIVTGDHSGNTGNTAAGLVEGGNFNTDFNIIKEYFELTNYDFVNTRKANPRHDFSRRLCNFVFKNVELKINPSCNVLLTDIQIAQVTPQNKLRKDRETFKMDACDAFRYLINAWFPAGFDSVQKFNA